VALCNGFPCTTDAEDDYSWSWRPEAGPSAGKARGSGVNGGWHQGAWAQVLRQGAQGKARAGTRAGSGSRARVRGVGRGRGEARVRGGGDVDGGGAGAGGGVLGAGDAGKGLRGAANTWPLSLAFSRLKAVVGQQWNVLWGAARLPGQSGCGAWDPPAPLRCHPLCAGHQIQAPAGKREYQVYPWHSGSQPCCVRFAVACASKGVRTSLGAARLR